MQIVAGTDVAHGSDEAAVARGVRELTGYPTFAVFEKLDEQVEQIHSSCGTGCVGLHEGSWFG
jgi:hypothetical protein